MALDPQPLENARARNSIIKNLLRLLVVSLLIAGCAKHPKFQPDIERISQKVKAHAMETEKLKKAVEHSAEETKKLGEQIEDLEERQKAAGRR